MHGLPTLILGRKDWVSHLYCVLLVGRYWDVATKILDGVLNVRGGDILSFLCVEFIKDRSLRLHFGRSQCWVCNLSAPGSQLDSTQSVRAFSKQRTWTTSAHNKITFFYFVGEIYVLILFLSIGKPSLEILCLSLKTEC